LVSRVRIPLSAPSRRVSVVRLRAIFRRVF